MDERFDELLMMVISQCSGIQGFFDIVFRFLRRRTDFFVLSKPGDKAGFPPGAAE
jgi:hypothetical protein